MIFVAGTMATDVILDPSFMWSGVVKRKMDLVDNGLVPLMRRST